MLVLESDLIHLVSKSQDIDPQNARIEVAEQKLKNERVNMS